MDQPQKYTDRLNTAFYASLGLPMVLFGWVYLPRKDTLSWTTSAVPQVPLWALYLLGIIVLGLAFWSIIDTRRKTKQVPVAADIEEKFDHFSSQWKRAYAVTAIASTIAVLLLFIFEHTFFVVIYALLLFIISLYRPSPRRWQNDMRWNKEQLQVFNQQAKIFKNLREHQ